MRQILNQKKSALLAIAGVLLVLPGMVLGGVAIQRDRRAVASPQTGHHHGDHHGNHHSGGHGNHHSGDHGGDHGGDSSAADHSSHGSAARVTLRATGPVAPGQPIPLEIAMMGVDGQPIREFETFQEKQLHLIIVRDDLGEFRHEHPTYRGNGVFTLDLTLPTAGNYTLFADYKPVGQGEQVSALPLTVPGAAPAAPPVTGDRRTDIDQTRVDLAIAPSSIQAGQDSLLTFNLKDANGQPATDLQPYLGERGHLVIVRQGDQLDRDAYIHAHAMGGTAPHQVSFHTTFPTAGTYRAWGQFQRGDRVVTAAFWIEVP